MRVLGVVWLFIKRIFCAHDFIFVRNIHGDEILEYGYQRSVWKCKHCGRVKYTNLTEDEWVQTESDNNIQTKKYLVIPSSGIGAEQLIRLYGVDRRDCIILHKPPLTPDFYYNHVLKTNKNLIVLEPRSDGNYNLEVKNEQKYCG